MIESDEKHFHRINGIAFRDNGAIAQTNRGLIEDVDSLPFPALDLIKLKSILSFQ